MPRQTVLSLVLAAVALIAAPGMADGRTLVVGDGSASCPDGRYRTIQAAVDAARPGDHIPVCPGRYTETVNVGTPRLQIFSRKRDAAFVQLPADQAFQTAFSLFTTGTTVRGFIFEPAEQSCEPAGRVLEAFGGATFAQNRVQGTGCSRFNDGVIKFFEDFPGEFSVVDNFISGFEEFGVRARRGRNTLNGNTILGGRLGMHLEGGKTVVQANKIEDAGAGVFADGFDNGSFDLWVAGNRLGGNGLGIVARDFGVGSATRVPLALRIQANSVLNSVQDGITVDFAPGLVTGNRSLGSGGLDCVMRHGFATWKDNVGVTDSPSNLCRAP
ncbi:MAG TPA: hypothetical protein VEX39_05740 [Thermoleophilaceae bacterium]|nr:hypothetical protein [Thermoleophilaceae bacterium]